MEAVDRYQFGRWVNYKYLNCKSEIGDWKRGKKGNGNWERELEMDTETETETEMEVVEVA